MVNRYLKMAWVQMNPVVGDVSGNLSQMKLALASAKAEGVNLLIFPELCLTGYPPEDLLFRLEFIRSAEAAVLEFAKMVDSEWVLIGCPTLVEPGLTNVRLTGPDLFNTVLVLHQGEILTEYHKWTLPNYLVFDEQRYFKPGSEAGIFELAGRRVGLAICEDLWEPQVIAGAKAKGAELLLSLNASPFHPNKYARRLDAFRARALEADMPIVYVNMVGGQDELVFDGRSMFLNKQGETLVTLPAFQAGIGILNLSEDFTDAQFIHFQPLDLRLPYRANSVCLPTDIASGESAEDISRLYSKALPEESQVYQALVVGLRDYVNKNGFSGAILGLSGGIDSAVTLCVAVDALGVDAVSAVMMPFKYTADMSIEDAQHQAQVLGIRFSVKPIHDIYRAFMSTLSEEFQGLPADTTEENLQARCRGVLLMAMSNKYRSIVLTTGNKSEIAVGYSTLYGDMAGGFDVLKDVPKTLVYRLARYINQQNGREVIPQRVIDRPPSAELRPDQTDQDSLPDYEVLDEVLMRYVEQDESVEQIVEAGFDKALVLDIVRRVEANEYKRRQAPLGVRVTSRAFGRDRRYPVTHRWRP